MAANETAPKVFVSYSWSSEDHQNWVIELAERLAADGVHVIIDVWDLKEGQDKYAFMEKMVTDSTIQRVLMVLDRRYAEKADKREGGVGTESQIISAELYGKVAETKFLPIVAQKDEHGGPFLPVYLRSRIYIDLSSTDRFPEEYEKLLRNIYERPAKQRPALGSRPQFLDEANPASSATRFRLESFVNAIERGNPQTRGHLQQFFRAAIQSLEAFQIVTPPPDPLDDTIVNKIHELKPLRDDLITAIETLAVYSEDKRCFEDVVRFFEDAARFSERPDQMQQWADEWFDHYRFFIRELFLYTVAIFVQNRKYHELNLLTEYHYLPRTSRRSEPESFSIFDQYIRSLDEMRKRRLNLNRISMVADLVKDRADRPNIRFEDLIEADVLLALKQILKSSGPFSARWFPRTGVFAERSLRPLTLFARLDSEHGLEPIRILFGIKSANELLAKLEQAYERQDLATWRFDYRPLPFYEWTGLIELKRRQMNA
jgi:hypothetical protein